VIIFQHFETSACIVYAYDLFSFKFSSNCTRHFFNRTLGIYSQHVFNGTFM